MNRSEIYRIYFIYFRKMNKLSYGKVSIKWNISRSTLHDLENNRRVFSKELFLSFISAFNIAFNFDENEYQLNINNFDEILNAFLRKDYVKQKSLAEIYANENNLNSLSCLTFFLAKYTLYFYNNKNCNEFNLIKDLLFQIDNLEDKYYYYLCIIDNNFNFFNLNKKNIDTLKLLRINPYNNVDQDDILEGLKAIIYFYRSYFTVYGNSVGAYQFLEKAEREFTRLLLLDRVRDCIYLRAIFAFVCLDFKGFHNICRYYLKASMDAKDKSNMELSYLSNGIASFIVDDGLQFLDPNCVNSIYYKNSIYLFNSFIFILENKISKAKDEMKNIKFFINDNLIDVNVIFKRLYELINRFINNRQEIDLEKEIISLSKKLLGSQRYIEYILLITYLQKSAFINKNNKLSLECKAMLYDYLQNYYYCRITV